jgi:N-methylhydantoinase A/oxoprolinase/acetone carboxylase beta subunit
VKIIGIDTGGTYTDSVVFDTAAGKVLYKNKILTTHSDLSCCIAESIAAFTEEQVEELAQVNISTTLAANALVEGTGIRTGVLLAGSIPDGEIPADCFRVIHGKHDLMGRLVEPIDNAELDEALDFFRVNADALAVSAYAGVRNPELELYMKKRALEILNIPVMCAHELTVSLGFLERTITAVLNIRLLPVITRLIDSVLLTMKAKIPDVPLMVVTSDGTLIPAERAKLRPLETVFSGSAASAIGGVFLTGQDNAVVMDMGGTTTDLVNVSGGKVRIRRDGAVVAGWKTWTKGIEAFVVGLGGDSRLRFEGKNKMYAGPQKAMPYCRAGDLYPALIDEMKELSEKAGNRIEEIEAFIGIQNCRLHLTLDEAEKAFLTLVADKPRTLFWLIHIALVQNAAVIAERLVVRGLVTRIALTPTDILHVSGEFTQWNRELPVLAVKIAAKHLGMDCTACIRWIKQEISGLILEILAKGKTYFSDSDTRKSIIAIGAPVRAWIPYLEKRLDAPVFIPENAEVAGAIGAAAAQIINNSEILIRPNKINNTYAVFSRTGKTVFCSLAEATSFAKELGRKEALFLEGNAEVSDETSDIWYEEAGTKEFIERKIRVSAVFSRK